MRLRIISDIHADINQDRNYQFDFGEDFIIACGDISGDRITTETWIRSNIKRGIFVEGNHLGYEKVTRDEKDTKQGSIEYLNSVFSQEEVKFLENDLYIVDDIVFLGCTLYTDFNLYEDPIYCLNYARKAMNDFRRVKVRDNYYTRKLNPYDTIKWHKQSINFINTMCKTYPDKKIVLVTHYAPSIDCISDEYKEDMLSAAYASNLEWIMEENHNLVLWCHGHVHHDVDFVKHGTRVVCCPFGYFNENKRDIQSYGLIIDTNEL